MSGADILEAVVRYGYRDGLASRDVGVSIRYVARQVAGVSDGRKIMPKLRRLADAGLVTIRRSGDTTFARPTERGVAVDDILAQITVARGGEFAPRVGSGITSKEMLAL